MKKLTIIFLLTAATILSPALPDNPFAGSRWQARVSYRDADNRSRSDTYEIVLAANGTCIVTVTTRQNGKELFQDADGLWSYDDRFFRLECDFPDAEIDYLPYINWSSVYQFDTMQNRFTLLVKPYPDANATVRVSFVRVDD
jgi:hypothetical protein